jgi:hypothetical protein
MKYSHVQYFDRAIKSLMAVSILSAYQASANPAGQASTLAKWSSDSTPSLVINVGDIVTPAQKDILNSGFTTFTLFVIGSSGDLFKDDSTSRLASARCSVKFDTWEETFEVTKILEQKSQTGFFKGFQDWSNDCLEISITNPKAISQILKQKSLKAALIIRQSTPDESLKIKSWLVSQQSGLVQGLYSHMLGNFQFQNSTQIKIKIPPLPNLSTKTSGPTP